MYFYTLILGGLGESFLIGNQVCSGGFFCCNGTDSVGACLDGLSGALSPVGRPGG